MTRLNSNQEITKKLLRKGGVTLKRSIKAASCDDGEESQGGRAQQSNQVRHANIATCGSSSPLEAVSSLQPSEGLSM